MVASLRFVNIRLNTHTHTHFPILVSFHTITVYSKESNYM